MQTIKTLSVATGLTLTGIVAVDYLSDSRASAYKYVIMPLTRLLDPETAHSFSVAVASHGLAPKDTSIDNPLLQFNVLTITYCI